MPLDLTGGLLQEVGKIKIGFKQEGTPAPGKYDGFVITTLDRDAGDNYIVDAALHQALGGGKVLKEIEVILPYDEPGLNFPVFREWYWGTKNRKLSCVCRGDGNRDGETGTAIMRDTGEPRSIVCRGIDCPCATGEYWDKRIRANTEARAEGKPLPFDIPTNKDGSKYMKPLCKLHGTLQVIIVGMPKLGGVYTFRTTSFYTIAGIQSGLAILHDITRGNIAGVPFKMRFQWAKHGGHKVQQVTFYYDGPPQKLFEHTIAQAQLKAGSMERLNALADRRRKALAAGDTGDSATPEDITAEFPPCQDDGVIVVPPEDVVILPSYDAEEYLAKFVGRLEEIGMSIPEALLRCGHCTDDAQVQEELDRIFAEVPEAQEPTEQELDDLGPAVEITEDFSLTPEPEDAGLSMNPRDANTEVARPTEEVTKAGANKVKLPPSRSAQQSIDDTAEVRRQYKGSNIFEDDLARRRGKKDAK